MTEIPANLLNTITTGDARELARALPDGCVDLVFTDPVYWQIEDYAWLAETAARVLKPGGSCLAYCGNVQQVEAGAAMLPFLKPRPVLGDFMSPPYPRLFDAMCHVNAMPLLWFTNGKGKPARWVSIHFASGYAHKYHGHQWGKNNQAVGHWLAHFTRPNALVFDPFCGGGTVPAVCKMLNRQYVAFEIDPATAERARQRVDATQAMHPAFTAEQEVMALE